MLWVKSLHIVFMVTWFAGLFYLPRLFVYHAQAQDAIGIERFKLMERKLYFGIMTPGAVLTIASGLWLWLGYGISGGWLYAKLAGCDSGGAPCLAWQADAGLSPRPQSTQPPLLSLDQRNSRAAGAPRRGAAGRPQALLARSD
jgi:hypothetical protein